MTWAPHSAMRSWAASSSSRHSRAGDSGDCGGHVRAGGREGPHRPRQPGAAHRGPGHHHRRHPGLRNPARASSSTPPQDRGGPTPPPDTCSSTTPPARPGTSSPATTEPRPQGLPRLPGSPRAVTRRDSAISCLRCCSWRRLRRGGGAYRGARAGRGDRSAVVILRMSFSAW
jgi:hypothetical protein